MYWINSIFCKNCWSIIFFLAFTFQFPLITTSEIVERVEALFYVEPDSSGNDMVMFEKEQINERNLLPVNMLKFVTPWTGTVVNFVRNNLFHQPPHLCKFTLTFCWYLSVVVPRTQSERKFKEYHFLLCFIPLITYSIWFTASLQRL